MNIKYISEKYQLNTLEIQILEYMDQHSNHIESISIRQMAKDNFTSTSIIYKLCNKLGYKGYKEMVEHFSTKEEDSLSFTELEYKEQFKHLLNQSKRIIVVGYGFSAPIAEYIHQRLTIQGYSSFSCLHFEMFNKSNAKDALFLVISHSGNTKDLVDLIQYVNDNNAIVISFVSNKDSFIGQNSTLCIPVGKYDSFTHDVNKKNLFFGQVLITFEHLLFDN